MSECTHSYSDGSGLIRHRSLKHGFEPRDDPEKIKEPTLVGEKFPNSKYARGTKRKTNSCDDDLATLPAHRPKRAKRSKPTPVASSRRSTTKKSKKSTMPINPAPTPEQQIDWTSSLYTLPQSQSPAASPLTVSDWDLGFSGCPTNDQLDMHSQPATGMNVADALAFPFLAHPAEPDSLEALFNSEPQTAAVNNWSFAPQSQMADFDFNFAAAALPLPACTGTIDPSMLMVPAPMVSPTAEPAGFASSPDFFDPCQAMGWGSYPSPGSSRESTASPDFMLFAGMSQWVPPPREPVVFNGYFAL